MNWTMIEGSNEGRIVGIERLESAVLVFGLARALAAESGGVTEAVLEEHFDPVMAEALQSIAVHTAELSLDSAHGIGRRA